MRNLALMLLLGACSAGPHCDRGSAEAALAAAAPGEAGGLGAGEVQGPLHVPPGVTLAGTDGTVVVAPVESGAIIALGGPSPTTVRDLDVRVDGRIGILARGGGGVTVANVSIDARRGIALGASELDDLRLEAVTMSGAVRADDADDPRWVRVAGAPAEPGECPDPSDCECTPGERDEAAGEVCDEAGRWATWTATFGLVLGSVADATLRDVEVVGFARWGVLSTDSEVRWEGGGVRDVLGVGVRQVGGALDLVDVAAEGTRAGLRGDRPYAVQVTDGARLTAARLELVDNDRYGLLVHRATGRLEDVRAERNGDAALWLSETDDFEVVGTATRLADNAFAGAVVVQSSGVRIADGAIATTVEQERPVGTIGVLRVGDGVHVTSSAGVSLADLRLTDNARAGVVVDLGAMGSDAVRFDGVEVSGTGSQLGAIAGRPAGAGQLTVATPADWDDGVTRSGDVAANDAAFGGTVAAVTEALPGAVVTPGDILGVVAPMF